MKRAFLVVALTGFVLLFVACENVQELFSDKIDEGFIEYDITYLQDERENPLISLLPTTMQFRFKDNVSIQKIEGWMSIFAMSGIADRNKDKSWALLKIMNEKYVYETSMKGPSFGFDEMPEYTLTETDCTKVIAGMLCKKADVVFKSDTVKGFSVYYTDMIKLDNPNSHNPFTKIPGVLLEYQMSFQKIPMRLVATKISKEEVLDEEFEIPAGYISVPREKMQEVIANLM